MDGARLTSVYFACVLIARLIAILLHGRVTSGKQTSIALVVAFLGRTRAHGLCIPLNTVSATLAVFASDRLAILWTGIAVLGVSAGALMTVTYCALETQLHIPEWYGAVWLVAAQVGRFVWPWVTGALLGDDSAG
jgi:hypothetical protein